MIRMSTWVVSAAVMIGIVQLAHAQAAEVAGMGSSTIVKMPQTMRLQAQLNVDGRDAQDAVAKLNEKKAAVKRKLIDLGANEGSVQFTNLQERSAAERAAEVAWIARTRMSAPWPAATTRPIPGVSLSCMLKADWAIKARNETDLLLEAIAIQEKVRAAGIAGREVSGLPPAESAWRVEMEAIAQMSGASLQRKISFIFVSKLTPEERTKAAAEAFARAKEQASILAKAAGSELGGVRQLSSHIGMPENFPMPDYEIYRYGYAISQAAQPPYSGDEAIGLEPAAVSALLIVQATFAMK